MSINRPFDPAVGLCSQCVFGSVVTSGRGSRFWLCLRSREDARFRKYPPLPVTRCTGFEHGTPEAR